MITMISHFKSTIVVSVLFSALLANCHVCRKAVCEFTLVISQTRTMIYTDPQRGAYSVALAGTRLQLVENTWKMSSDPLIGLEVDARHVITADGVRRNIFVINGQFPGPTLEVLEGCQVIVNVVNHLMTSGVTIHWHGLHQRNSAWMDGVPYVTQCPILPRQSFTYRFQAVPAGTHWYHSHFSTQRIDGLSGAFIVHRRHPLDQQLVPSYILSVSDWFPHEGHNLETRSPFRRGTEAGTGEDYFLNPKIREYGIDGVEATSVRFFSGLINGRGRSDDQRYPLEHFYVESGQIYRFRTLNTAAEYAFSISVDDHNLRVVALDGYEIEPIDVTDIILFPGERADFELACNKPLENSQYWIRAQSLRIGKGRSNMLQAREDGAIYEILAVLTYDNTFNFSTGPDPTTHKTPCTSNNLCRIFNCPAPYYPRHTFKECVPLSEAQSIDRLIGSTDQDETGFVELFFNIGFIGGSYINGYRFVGPLAPLFQPDHGSISCSQTCEKNARRSCMCTHTVPLEWNKTYHIILSNYEKNYSVGHHPMHIHGHSFEVLKMGFPIVNHTGGPMLHPNPDIACHDNKCTEPRWARPQGPSLNLKNPPVKDTVLVPALGYVVLRLRADNPGLWMMHCHSETHNLEGMALLFDEASSYYPPPPKTFPTCRSFNWSETDYDKYRDFLDQWKTDSQHSVTGICNQLYVKIFLILKFVDIIGLVVGRLVLGAVGISTPFLLYRKCSLSSQEQPRFSMPTRPELRRRARRECLLADD